MTDRPDISMNIIVRVLVVVAVVWFLYVIRDVIALFFVAIIITAALNPVIARVIKRTRWPRTLTVIMVYLVSFSAVGALIAFIVPTISGELEGFVRDVGNAVRESTFLSSMFTVEDLTSRVTGLFGNLLSTTAGFFTAIVSIVATVSMSFYMSLEEDGLKRALLAITPEQHQKYVSSLIDRIQNSFGRWMAGQLVTMVFVGLMYYIVLKIFGVQYAGLLAVLGGLLEIIPYFGPILSAIPAVALALPLGGATAAFVGAGYLVINLVENQFLIPRIMNKAIGLNPVLVILALLIGAKVAGVVGLLLAVPLAGAIGVFLKDVIDKKIL